MALHRNKTDRERMVMAYKDMDPSSDVDVGSTEKAPAKKFLKEISVFESPVSKCQIVMASATVTGPVRRLLEDVEGFNISFSELANPSTKAVLGPKLPAVASSNPTNSSRISMKIVEIDGFHKTLPTVTHEAIDLKGRDKMVVLDELLQVPRIRIPLLSIFA